MSESQSICQYQLGDKNGLQVGVLNYGAILQSIRVPVGERQIEVLLGFQAADDYLEDKAHIGAIAGRYCNRIANASFELNGEKFHLEKNDGDNLLHGGPQGFNQKFWRVVEYQQNQHPKITLAYESADGEQGFPGNLKNFVTYRIVEGHQLVIDINAQCDKPCPVNLTGHAYFNLNSSQRLIRNHELQIDAKKFLPIADNCIPTGELREVAESDFDFQQAAQVGPRIESNDLQIRKQKGIDHNFVLNGNNQSARAVAMLYSPESKIEMTLSTNMPGLQIYTGNHLSAPFESYQGICLEPQYFPDSPNQVAFPDCILHPEKSYHHQIIYDFRLRNNGT